MLAQFLRKDNDKFIYDGEMLDIFIPMSFFETKVAVFRGSEIDTLGLLWVRGYKADKPIFTELMNLPSWLTLFPASIRDMDINVTGHDKSTKYKVCTFYKGSPIMYTYLPKNSDYVQSFVDMVLNGKIDYVPYSKLLSIWQKNTAINSVSLGVPSSSLEIILGEMYTAKGDPDTTYAVAKAKNPKLGEFDYESRNIRDICSRSSTFAALSFEDFDTMIAASLNRNRENKEQQISPLEKTIKY